MARWIPISRSYLDMLPSNRPYTKLEAAFAVTADLQDNKVRSANSYARQFGWSPNKVIRFLADQEGIIDLSNTNGTANHNYNSQLGNTTEQIRLSKVSGTETEQRRNRDGKAKDNNNRVLQAGTEQQRNGDGTETEQLLNRYKIEREDPCPSSSSKALFDLWNEVVAGTSLSSVREFSSTRQKKCTARLRERPLDEWTALFRRIVATPFLCGLNDRGWKADFDWIIANDGNSAKVLEGKYDRTTSTSRPSDSRYSEIFAGA